MKAVLCLNMGAPISSDTTERSLIRKHLCNSWQRSKAEGANSLCKFVLNFVLIVPSFIVVLA